MRVVVMNPSTTSRCARSGTSLEVLVSPPNQMSGDAASPITPAPASPNATHPRLDVDEVRRITARATIERIVAEP